MKFYADNSAIIACSTGILTNSAIGIIRISGVNFLEDINKFFNVNLVLIESRFATFCKLHFNNKVYDEVVLTLFRGPNSYNGEDILEIGVHGNQINIQSIIHLITNNSSVRLAHPGEFSFRAYKNKKMNLSQVEGLDLLLNASSIFELEQGQSLISGNLRDSFKNLLDNFLSHKSSVELGFDFLEDMGEEQFKTEFSTSLALLEKNIDFIYNKIKNNNFKIIQPEVCLYGLPNSGKSSLFNRILKDDRALVSDIAGTTRDYINESFFINESVFKLVDTAGIRDTSDFLEGAGINKALEITKNSFYKILVVNPFNFKKEYFAKTREVLFDLIVFTHIDIEGFAEKSTEVIDFIRKVAGPIDSTSSGPIEPTSSGPIEPTSSGSIEPLFVNLIVEDVDFIHKLNSLIHAKYMKLIDTDPILIERHVASIRSIHTAFHQYLTVVNNESDMGIISSELNIVGHCISELVGIISPDDILNNIFDNFCIGK